jgi:hypothetical protein
MWSYTMWSYVFANHSKGEMKFLTIINIITQSELRSAEGIGICVALFLFPPGVKTKGKNCLRECGATPHSAALPRSLSSNNACSNTITTDAAITTVNPVRTFPTEPPTALET